MGDGGIPERAQDVNQRIGVLVRNDVDERLCAGRVTSSDEVRELDGRRDPLLRVVHGRQSVQPRVRHLRDANDRLRLADGAPSAFANARHELEEGGLAAGTEADERCPEHLWESRMVARGFGLTPTGWGRSLSMAIERRKLQA